MSNELKTLFPRRTIDCGGLEVAIRPLSITQIPDATADLVAIGERLIGLIVQASGVIKNDGTLDMTAAVGALGKLDLAGNLGPALAAAVRCLDRVCLPKPEQIPGEFLPDLLEVFLEQNFSRAQLGKWTGLGAKVKELLAARSGAAATPPAS